MAGRIFGQALEHDTRESTNAFRTFPATKSSIEALEVVKDVESVFGADRIIRYCMICLSLYSSQRSISDNNDDDDDDHKKVLRMPCSHLNHKECIVRWLETSHLCPLCRYAMPTN